jgi:hypothetical protein
LAYHSLAFASDHRGIGAAAMGPGAIVTRPPINNKPKTQILLIID